MLYLASSFREFLIAKESVEERRCEQVTQDTCDRPAIDSSVDGKRARPGEGKEGPERGTQPEQAGVDLDEL